ncbi:MAG: hypothetical protein BGO21_16500 [Dyadobacter sp. 50-39]|nr:MAG: hypothetical protein BGO21_16500 [Dyadobacter sp. 50-39]
MMISQDFYEKKVPFTELAPFFRKNGFEKHNLPYRQLASKGLFLRKIQAKNGKLILATFR